MGVDVKKELLTRDYSELTVLRGSRGGFTGLGIGVQEKDLRINPFSSKESTKVP